MSTLSERHDLLAGRFGREIVGDAIKSGATYAELKFAENFLSGKLSSMNRSMACRAQSQAIRNAALQFRSHSKTDNMMHVEAIFGSTFATGATVPLENKPSPLLVKSVLARAPRYLRNTAFPFVIFAGCVGLSHFFTRLCTSFFAEIWLQTGMSLNSDAPRLAAAMLQSVRIMLINSKFGNQVPPLTTVAPLFPGGTLAQIFFNRNTDRFGGAVCVAGVCRHGC